MISKRPLATSPDLHPIGPIKRKHSLSEISPFLGLEFELETAS